MGQLPPNLSSELPRPAAILEIGVGRFENEKFGQVWVPPTITRMELGPDQSYLGIDIGAIASARKLSAAEIAATDAKMHDYWREICEGRPNDAITFEQADATNLPYSDGTFGRIVACNMYGSGADDKTLVAILRESRRLLSPDREGEMVIYDDHTPNLRNLKQLSAWFGDHGLALSTTEPPRLVTPSMSPEQYQHYGFPTFDRNDPPEKFRQDINRHLASTLWILGKTSFTDTVAPPEEAKPVQAEPDHGLGFLAAALRRRIRRETS